MTSNKKITISLIFFCVLIVLLVLFRVVVNKNSDFEKSKVTIEKQTGKNTIEQDTNTIEEIKKEIDATANANMYQLEEEYDGRKIIQIKPDIQYSTVLAGILKDGNIREDEVQSILKKSPNKSGIWISRKSRDKFLKLLTDNGASNYKINKEGYLHKKDENGIEKLNNAINSNKLYIIDISGTCYTRDELSGKIVEYPFEEMDPNQILEVYSVENSSILEITSNSKGILSNKEILNEVLLNLE